MQEGTAAVETETDGSSGGIVVGVGRGQGGVSVNYESYDLSTRGTHTTMAAKRYAPPIRPDDYDDAEWLLKAAQEALQKAAAKVQDAERFALSDVARRGLFEAGANWGVDMSTHAYNDAASRLGPVLQHKRVMFVWARTRVCSRCGEPYVLKSDREAWRPPFEVPRLEFSGMQRRCPSCKSYEWKPVHGRAEQFGEQLKEQLKLAKAALEKATADVSNPRQGFFSRLSRAVLPPDPAARAAQVEQVQLRLDAHVKRMESAKSSPDFLRLRYCHADGCGQAYTLEQDEDGTEFSKPHNFKLA